MSDYAGEVVIEVDANTTGFDKKMREVEKRLEELEAKAKAPHEYKGAMITGGWNLTDEEQKEYDALYEEYEKMYQIDLERSREQRKYIEGIRQETKEIDEYEDTIQRLREEDPELYALAQILDEKMKKYKEITSEMKSSDLIDQDDIDKAEKLKEEIRSVLNEIEKARGIKYIVKGVNDTKEEVKEIKKNINGISSSIDKVGGGLKKVIKNVVKWGLAIFSIRSAYNFVRQSVSTLSQYNKQLATDLQYIRFAVATILEKTILKLVNWVFRLLQYVNYLAMSWFKVNLFANASADRMQDMSDSAKETRKQLAGFDEMNIIGDSSSGSGGGSPAPSVDLSKDIGKIKPPKWLIIIRDIGKWIIDHWKIIVGAIVAVGLALIGIKIAKWIGDAKKAKDATGGLATSFTGFFDGLGKGIEAIAVLGGLALVISSLTGLITAFSESGMTLNDVIGLMGTILGTIVILMGSIALLGPSMTVGLVPFLGVVAGISAILTVMALTLPTILNAVGNFITTIAPSLIQLLDTIGINIDRIITSLGTNLPPIINSIGGLFGTVFNGIAKIISTVGNTIVNVLNTARDLVTTVLNAILNFINRLGPAINNFVDNVIRAMTKLINFMISGIEYLVNTLVIRAVNKMIEAINEIGEYVGIEIPTVSQVSIPRFVPKFAKGTILNAPGKGVPVGGYQGLAGEAGREAYLPLSDRQLLEELGSTIGRYVNINATIPVQIGNRLVMREIKRIKAEDDFAYNS